MTGDDSSPDFDPTMEGQAAVELDNEYHQVTAEYDHGERIDITACEMDLSDVSVHEFAPRKNYRERGVPPCEDCWPDAIIEEVSE